MVTIRKSRAKITWKPNPDFQKHPNEYVLTVDDGLGKYNRWATWEEAYLINLLKRKRK